MLQRVIKKLPTKYKWAVHNLLGHPLMEISQWFGYQNLASKIHDRTMPSDD